MLIYYNLIHSTYQGSLEDTDNLVIFHLLRHQKVHYHVHINIPVVTDLK